MCIFIQNQKNLIPFYIIINFSNTLEGDPIIKYLWQIFFSFSIDSKKQKSIIWKSFDIFVGSWKLSIF